MTNTSVAWLAGLVADVQHNCHISDAQHARNYSLCIYLLKMREFYRWEQGYPFRTPLPKEQLGAWLSERETLWEGLESSDFTPLRIESAPLAPFDNHTINLQLVKEGWVYSGGYVGPKPHFFLAELEQVEHRHDTTIYVAGRELARELTAPPAMSLGNTIFLRRESLRRMIWEKLEEWGWGDAERPIARSVARYDFRHDFEQALDAMTSDELETLLQHELGEIEVGFELGGQWEEMLAALPHSRAEYQLRAIRDHLVDCRYTLPWLLDEGRESSLHFFMANYSALRREIFPELEQAYRHWVSGGTLQPLKATLLSGADRWYAEAEQALQLFRQYGEDTARLVALYSEGKPAD
ncbi:MAG TPA: hypothetical protein VGE50_12250 [Gammaproteobacteria bacterium]